MSRNSSRMPSASMKKITVGCAPSSGWVTNTGMRPSRVSISTSRSCMRSASGEGHAGAPLDGTGEHREVALAKAHLHGVLEDLRGLPQQGRRHALLVRERAGKGDVLGADAQFGKHLRLRLQHRLGLAAEQRRGRHAATLGHDLAEGREIGTRLGEDRERQGGTRPRPFCTTLMWLAWPG